MTRVADIYHRGPLLIICPGCQTPPLPRGYDVKTLLCWFCAVAR